MSDYHNQRAREIVSTIIYATIATTSEDGKPWNSPVRHVMDDELNIYWFSDKESQHSRNVRANGEVFIVIYDSTVLEGEGAGVYIEATATELDDPEEVRKARAIKNGPDHDAPDDFIGDAVRRVYKAVPKRMWMNEVEMDGKRFVRDLRVEVDLLPNQSGK